MPSISVIVPIYKVEDYLCRCVDSILGQGFQDFELVLVEDGSPDRCGDMCEEYAAKDSRVHVIHQENGGLSAARNAGIDWALANSDSEFLTFIDSDDWIAPNYLELLYRAVQETGCDMSACDFQRTAGEDLSAVPSCLAKAMTPDEFYCGETGDAGSMVVAVCKLYRKDLFQDVRYPVGKIHEDEFTTYRLIYKTNGVAVVDAKLYAYFQNADSIMQSKWNPKRLHSLEAIEQQIQFAKDRSLPNFWRKASEQYIYSVAQHISQADQAYQKSLRKKLRWGLSQGRKSGSFLFDWESLWAYELAYPMIPAVWWLVFRIKAWMGR